jgi:EAL domain-containing protein (putative c-di-GMP-specific phosphodiesterase class I)/GGDEF domain-containing protein
MAAPAASIALLLIEVGEVARLQARLGIAEGTLLLESLFHRLVDAIAGRGSVIPLGDGRYCVLIGAIRNSGHAVLAGEKLVRTAEDAFNAANLALKPTLNIGISLYPVQAEQPETLLKLAQIATEAARKRGVRIVVFDDMCGTEVLSPWELGGEFAQALATGDLSVYYQPKVSMITGRPSGVESLMRWFRDGKTVAMPDVFIPLAEEAGMICGTTWYSLSNSLRMAAEYADLSVAVNITPGMLHHREFIDMIRTAVTTWSAAGNRLTLEVTEGALIADFAVATARLKKLRDMGLRVSIDDFGTGYSSLSYFKKIPADELKIDKSFVLGMATDSADRHLVQTIIGLSQHFKLEIVAEGVESRETFDALAAMGCHHAQGHLFSPALCSEKLKEWLRRNSRDLRVGLGSA